jgi:hypothetical protein
MSARDPGPWSLIAAAQKRAETMIAATSYFIEFEMMVPLARDARMNARLMLELSNDLEAERSARIAIQERLEDALSILAAHAYDAIGAE